MVPFESKKRFRINPIEFAIFAVISLIFVKSSYSLLYSKQGFEAEALQATAQDPLAPTDGRSPASFQNTLRSPDMGLSEKSISAPKSFAEVKIGCEPAADSPFVSSNKIRLIGSLCAEKLEGASDGSSVEELPQDLKKISVINTSAKVTAVVFADYPNQKFSTDYMSLNQGKNLIYVQYEYKDGKTYGREFSVVKN